MTRVLKRLVVGVPYRSDQLPRTLLPKRTALPVFASDAMSSVAYAPQEVFAVLSVAGISTLVYAPWIAGMVALVMVIVIASYRQNVHAYPSGGGDYEVASQNLGPNFGLIVGSALLVDYILTVAVSTASGIANIGSVIAVVGDYPVLFSMIVIAVVTTLNLRGARESGVTFAVPVYIFLFVMIAMIITGLIRFATGAVQLAPSADFSYETAGGLSSAALMFLLLRSFSSGSAALTGVEAVANGVPAFRKPKSRNAATTLVWMAIFSIVMLIGLVVLAIITKVHIAGPDVTLVGAPADYSQNTLVVQVARAVFDGFPIAYFIVALMTGLILMLACNTAFNGFPWLSSVLARDEYLPRQLRTRGDRLVFSNGIIFLAIVAGVLVAAFQANVSNLIHLYIVGVFVAFTASQAGMVRHWARILRTERDKAARRKIRRSQLINTIGLCATATVLVIVVVTKFFSGAWIAVLAMAVIFFTMKGIRRHYRRVAETLAGSEEDLVLPSRIHGIVLVSRLNLPALRALAYARATRPDVLEAVMVNVDPDATATLASEWEDREIPVPLKVIDSPFREMTGPILDYVRSVRRQSPRDVVTVFIPEYVVEHWWQQLLHNQSALRLKGRLLFTPGVMVTSVPWQLAGAIERDERQHGNRTRGRLDKPGEQSSERTGWFGEVVASEERRPSTRPRRGLLRRGGKSGGGKSGGGRT